jgi:hypothetical protein
MRQSENGRGDYGFKHAEYPGQHVEEELDEWNHWQDVSQSKTGSQENKANWHGHCTEEVAGFGCKRTYCRGYGPYPCSRSSHKASPNTPPN